MLAGTRRTPVPQRPADRPDRHGGGEGRRRTRRRGERRGVELPPLPAIPLQLEPSDGKPRYTQRPPGQWCLAHGVRPPPGSFQADKALGAQCNGSAARVRRPEVSRESARHERAARRHRTAAGDRQALRVRAGRAPGPSQATVPAARVPPAGVVPRQRDHRADRARGDPVRRGHRTPDRRAHQAVRRPVVLGCGDGAGRRSRGLADRHGAPHRRRRGFGDLRRPRLPPDPGGDRRHAGARCRSTAPPRCAAGVRARCSSRCSSTGSSASSA